ncbi:OmpA family protein [Hymenobacter sp. ASUV-10]|uniref:OmpA family protein n=1 Tax=Hymenobacter aranciens TaxID=3063996 RepID=A0ABT9BC80_9BACT|nr:OmpA family protein [Hymenobacter sp. ASUV-10]MDO7874632.1 OmpA family protein [Hymenobacter sp. ASUV-10]
MKCFSIRWLLLSLLVLRLSSPARAQTLPPDLLLNEDFQDNRRSWYTGNNADWQVSLTPGDYRLTSRNSGGRFAWQNLALNTAADFVIEAEMSNTSSGALVWGARSAADAPIAAIIPGGFVAGGWRGGKYSTHNEGATRTTAARPLGEWNTLRVARRGATIYYSVNGTEVWHEPVEAVAAAPLGTLVGFQSEGNTVVRARRLRVWHHSLVKRLPGLPTTLSRERLGPQLNSPRYNDGAPVLSPDGQELYFSHWQPDAPKRCDILRSRRQPDGSWGPAEDLGAPLNNGGYSCPLGITPDGQTLLVLNHYLPDGRPAPSGGCSLSHRQPDGRWGVPEPLVIPGLPNRVAYYYFSLAADGLTLVMAFEDEAPGSPRGDLYVSHRAADGRWSRPQSLGPVVNSAGRENSPFLAPDGRTLYFASEGHPGYGDSDLFVTRRLDDSWTRWSEPLNLGPGINSSGMEACYTLSAAGDEAYFCARQWPEPLEDIFRVKLPAAARPSPTLLLRGRVLDALTHQPIGGAAVYYELLPEGQTAGLAQAAVGTGAYQVVLPSGGTYGLRATAPGYLSVNENRDLSTASQYAETTQDLLLLPLPAPVAARAVVPAATEVAVLPSQLRGVAAPAVALKEEKITLNNVFFVRSKPVLLPGSFPELKRLAQTLKDSPTLEIRLDGHTDNVGGPAENKTLSEQRVAAIKAFLVKQGIAENRLSTRGYGGIRPIAPNDTEANKARNRRVEFVILQR